jgi:hypothetical protein
VRIRGNHDFGEKENRLSDQSSDTISDYKRERDTKREKRRNILNNFVFLSLMSITNR